MSACTSPTCYGVPAHLAVDVTPKPERIKTLNFYGEASIHYLYEAMAFRDCSRMENTFGKTHKVSPGARRTMRHYMRAAALRAVSALRNSLARRSWR